MSSGRPPKSEEAGLGPRMGVRVALFTVLVVVCVAVGGAYVVYARGNNPRNGKPTEPLAAGSDAARAAVMAEPHVVFRNTELGSNYGKVEVVPLSAPAGPRFVTPLQCDRVAMGRRVGVCLTTEQGVVTTYRGEIFDAQFRVVHEFPLPGLPSRVRLSPDGKYAAMTVFVYGDSYAADNFSTRTLFVDTSSGAVLGDLEGFDVTEDGQTVTAISRNYWGVTFAADSNTFYATLAVGAEIHLIQGNLKQRQAHTIADDTECPSLSPDQTRVAYKKRVGGGFTAVQWRLHVLDLRTGRDRELAETRNVDDQVEWLDNSTVLYGVPRASSGSGATDTYAVPADGSGAPTLFIRGAWSPAVAPTGSA
jgi:hypothetical protein